MRPLHLKIIRFLMSGVVFTLGIGAILGSSVEDYDDDLSGAWKMVYQTEWDGSGCFSSAPDEDIYMRIIDNRHREYLIVDYQECYLKEDECIVEDGRIFLFDEGGSPYDVEGSPYDISSHTLVIYNPETIYDFCEEKTVFERIDDWEYEDLLWECYGDEYE